MDISKLVEVLRATLDPVQREQAEKQLKEVHEIIGFAPVLLQVVMSAQVNMPVRQAGVIYLKNMLSQYWMKRDHENVLDNMPFNIHEQDRQSIRESIIEAIIHAPEPVRVQLCMCLRHIIKSDFPERWPNAAEKMAMYINSDNQAMWVGALISVYQFVKVFDYKTCEEQQTMDDTMKHMLPILYQCLLQLSPDPSEASCFLQKQILKIFFAYTHKSLPLSVLTKDIFTQWIEAIHLIVDKSIPPETNHIDEEYRDELACWKLKKWAVKILLKIFESYGSPGVVLKEYTEFSEWYIKTFSYADLNVLFKILESYRQSIFVAPRVLQLTLNYINKGVSHAFTWKFIKQHIQIMIQDVIFPLMCPCDEEDDLWNSDPLEYIRVKYYEIDNVLSPVRAAQAVFHCAAAKRKEVLFQAMRFCMSVLTDPATLPRMKDGALHMVGALADVLLKSNIYKDQVEMMLTIYVFPSFNSECGFLRARACWVVRHFAVMNFKNDQNLLHAVELVKSALCLDNLPVQVEAAIALQILIFEQDKAKTYIQPYVKPVILELLKVIRETENDELTGVVQKLVFTFVDEVIPIAVKMMSHLAQTFVQVMGSEGGGLEEKAITTLSILNTMMTILIAMENQKEIIIQLEGIILNVIGITLQTNIMALYQVVMLLINSLTSSQISTNMWEVFDMICQKFQKDGIDYFKDMMPALHNYITVDTAAFLANPTHLEMIYSMCKSVLNADIGEDTKCCAAKLLEVILLQCPGKVDHVLGSFVELVLQILTREVQTSELRTICLQVVIAGLYYNSPMLLDFLNKTNLPNVHGSILSHFLKQWLHEADCLLGLHDRKIRILGLCSLLSLVGQRPQEITEVASQILPAALLLFHGLKRAYANLAQEDLSDSDYSDDDKDAYDGEILSSDEDEIDESNLQNLERWKKAKLDEDSSDGELTDDGAEKTALESYTTVLDAENSPVDEYVIFKNILTNLPNHDSAWYQAVVAELTQAQLKEIEGIFKLAEQRKALADSKKIKEGGGYMFTNHQVPKSFNFGPN